MNSSIEAKYGIVYLGMQRYYKEDLHKRDFFLENCTPYYFKIGYDEFIDSRWTGMLQQICDYLIEEYDYDEEKLLSFSVEWSKQKIFIKESNNHGHYKLKNGLYINANHTAVHCCWLLQDILNFFGVNLNECTLLIKKKPISELKEVKEYYKKMVKGMFCEYLIQDMEKDKEFYDKCINVLDKMDVLFSRGFKTFESIYLIDDPTTYSALKSKFIKYIMDLNYYSLSQFELIKNRIEIYSKFMYKVFKY